MKTIYFPEIVVPQCLESMMDLSEHISSEIYDFAKNGAVKITLERCTNKEARDYFISEGVLTKEDESCE